MGLPTKSLNKTVQPAETSLSAWLRDYSGLWHCEMSIVHLFSVEKSSSGRILIRLGPRIYTCKWLWVTCLTFICWLSNHGYTWSTRCIQESIIDHLPWYFALWIIENCCDHCTHIYLGMLFHLLTSSYSATVPKLAKSTAPIFKATKNVTFQDWIGKWCTYLIHKVGVWL